MKHTICTVYRSANKDECYLYVNKQRGLECLPEDLRSLFGRPVAVMTMLLKPEKPLARADVKSVIAAVEDKGYYLQMPPPMDPEMQKIHLLNSKMSQ